MRRDEQGRALLQRHHRLRRDSVTSVHDLKLAIDLYKAARATVSQKLHNSAARKIGLTKFYEGASRRILWALRMRAAAGAPSIHREAIGDLAFGLASPIRHRERQQTLGAFEVNEEEPCRLR